MKPEDALVILAQMAEAYVNTQPPAVRAALLSLAQQAINAINAINEQNKPKE